MRILWSAIVVLGLLAIPLLCTSQSTLHRAHRKRAATDIRMLMGALEDFASSHENRYPADLHELFGKDALNNPYLVKFNMHEPRDGWGRAFVYEPPTATHPRPRVLSYGADGQRGGSGDDADVDSESLPSDH
jgi:general secretion pathway protein G